MKRRVSRSSNPPPKSTPTPSPGPSLRTRRRGKTLDKDVESKIDIDDEITIEQTFEDEVIAESTAISVSELTLEEPTVNVGVSTEQASQKRDDPSSKSDEERMKSIKQLEAAIRSLSDSSEGEDQLVEGEIEEKPMFENLFEKKDSEIDTEVSQPNKTDPSWKEVVTLSNSPGSHSGDRSPVAPPSIDKEVSSSVVSPCPDDIVDEPICPQTSFSMINSLTVADPISIELDEGRLSPALLNSPTSNSMCQSPVKEERCSSSFYSSCQLRSTGKASDQSIETTRHGQLPAIVEIAQQDMTYEAGGGEAPSLVFKPEEFSSCMQSNTNNAMNVDLSIKSETLASDKQLFDCKYQQSTEPTATDSYMNAKDSTEQPSIILPRRASETPPADDGLPHTLPYMSTSAAANFQLEEESLSSSSVMSYPGSPMSGKLPP